MLVINSISKSYIQRGTVLDNLSVEVKKGDSIAIMGPSGSGKTTLMNIIGLMDRPDSGTVTFNNAELEAFTDDQAAAYRGRNIGFVFQDHLLLPHLTVSENIHLPLLALEYSRDELSERARHISELMQRTSISDLSNKYPAQISGGEAQRVALVRALANNPSVLLADEPTGSLDEKNADLLGNLLMDMNRDFSLTLIVATHSPELAKKLSKILRLVNGKLIA